jgi:hypothetical protein
MAMSGLTRRVINVTPDQVIGPPRKRRQRRPKGAPMLAADGAINVAPWWLDMPPMSPPPSAPTQQGFGHFDRIAREVKR